MNQHPSIHDEGELTTSQDVQVTALEAVTGTPYTLRAEWLVVGSVILAAAGQLLIKAALTHLVTASVPAGMLHTLLSPGILTGLFIYGLGTLVWVRAVSMESISYLYPLSALNYAIVALGGHLLFGEIIRPGRWLGIAVMTFGIYLLTRAVARERM